MTAHAKLSPSSASRWLNCAGCIRLCANIPRKPSSIYAMTGSIAHEVGALCLQKDLNAADFIGRWGGYTEGEVSIIGGEFNQLPPSTKPNHLLLQIDRDMAVNVQIYVDEVRRIYGQSAGQKRYIETLMDMNWLVPGMFGTADSTVVEPMISLDVTDYKNGFGVVEVGTPEDPNPQLASYAAGAVGRGNPHMVEEININVVQPNAPHPHGPVRRLTMTIDQLRAWLTNVLIPGAQLALSPNAPLKAGTWCKYCDANNPAICPEIRKEVETATGAMFPAITAGEVITLTDPAQMGGEELGNILHFKGVFNEWLNSCEAEAYSRVRRMTADAPTQYKIVQGKGSRKWNAEEDAVTDALSLYIPQDKMTSDPAMLSVAQMEKALKASGMTHKEALSILAPLVSVTRGEQMVHIDDSRKAINRAEQMFGTNEEV